MSKEAFKAKKMSVFQFLPDELNIAMEQTDPLFDSRAMEKVDDAFVQTIVKRGIIQPVVITKRDNKPWIVAGRRRTLGARKANEIRAGLGLPPVLVPCKYERGTDEQLAETIIIENEHRKDDNVIQKAEKASRMLNMGYGIKDIAPMFGVSTQTINNWLSYLELPKSDRDAIISGEQSAHAAKRKHREKSGVRTVTMKRKKEIRDRISETDRCEADYNKGFVAALRWVLGEEND